MNRNPLRPVAGRASLSAAAVLALAVAASAAPLKAGDKAPNFTAPLSDGTTFTLSAGLDKAPIVLYFYPKDFTPGCTKEACSLRDAFPRFQDFKTTVIGISYDSIESHKKFSQKHKLPFPLASDADKKVAKAFGVDGLMFAKRATFIVGKDGVILWANPAVDPSAHGQELQDALAQFAPK
jgi:peroxiredoxin Q/BCP